MNIKINYKSYRMTIESQSSQSQIAVLTTSKRSDVSARTLKASKHNAMIGTANQLRT